MKLRWEVFVRLVHKWSAVLIGIQILMWFLSGFIMSYLHMDDVHGDHLVKKSAAKLIVQELAPFKNLDLSPDPIEVSDIKIKLRAGRPVYVVHQNNEDHIFDATNGSRLKLLTEAEIELAANDYLTHPAAPVAIKLLTTPVHEFKGLLPVFRLDYESPEFFSLYLSPATGEFLTVRNTRWRIFDFFWMLHIMDYSERENVNTPWLRVLSFVSIIVAITGLLLIYIWLKFTWKRRKAKRAAIGVRSA